MLEPEFRLENQLCFPLYAAARKVTNLYTPFFQEVGITYTQYVVFLVLWEKDGLSMGELGKRLFLDNGTLTPLVKAKCKPTDSAYSTFFTAVQLPTA